MPEAQCRGAETRTALQGHRDPGMPVVLAQQGLGREGEQAPAPSMGGRRTPCKAGRDAPSPIHPIAKSTYSSGVWRLRGFPLPPLGDVEIKAPGETLASPRLQNK